MLSKQEIDHIAQLARLELRETEKTQYGKQLGRILDYFDKLKQIKTNGVTTADGGTRDLENVWREDQQSTTNNQQPTKNLIDMAPEVEQDQVKVKSVF